MTALEQQKKNQEPEVRRVPQQTKVLLTWKAPARPFKRRDREYYTTIGAIVFLTAVILLFLREWLLIAVMVSLAFVAYVLASVEPGDVEHTLTNKGIRTGGKLYPWDELARFWFSQKWGQKMLAVEVKTGFPGRLLLLLGDEEKERIRKIMSKYLELERPAPAWGDKAARWLSDKVPLEG